MLDAVDAKSTGAEGARLEHGFSRLGEHIAEFYSKTTERKIKNWVRIPGFTKKDTRAVDTANRIQGSFQKHFPDVGEQTQVAEAANTFLQKLTTQLVPSLPGSRDVYAHLDRFITSFPDSILDGLGDQATADITERVFQIGTDAIDKGIQVITQNPDQFPKSTSGNQINKQLEWTTLILAESLPLAIKNAGTKREALLSQIEAGVHTKEFSLSAFVNFYKDGIHELSEQTQNKISWMYESVGLLDTFDTSASPFNQSDRRPWKGEDIIGELDRSPIWKDLADMVRNTEEDAIEYGLIVSKDPENGMSRTDCKRGRGVSHIDNRGNRTDGQDSIFFHSHPSTSPQRELVAQLVSDYDLAAGNIEGGYKNIVTLKGVVFHTGMETGNPPEFDKDDILPGVPIYTIESGDSKIKGKSFVAHQEEIDPVLQQIQEITDPFVYSIYDRIQERRHYFVHIPWDKLDPSLSLEEVCYGDGLKRLVEKIPGIPTMPLAQNVLEGLTSGY